MPKNPRWLTKELESEEREGWSYVLVESPLQVPLSRWLHSSPARRVSLGCHCCKTHAPAMSVPSVGALLVQTQHFRMIWIPFVVSHWGLDFPRICPWRIARGQENPIVPCWVWVLRPTNFPHRPAAMCITHDISSLCLSETLPKTHTVKCQCSFQAPKK